MPADDANRCRSGIDAYLLTNKISSTEETESE